jgi:hypothetical protein
MIGKIHLPGTKMQSINDTSLADYRSKTFRLSTNLRLRSPEEAVDFVNECGFAFFWPVKGFDLPSMWKAVAGDRPVPNNHDDPGHITWGWKDSMLDKKRWYYGKLLRKRATLVSLDIIPYFYALSDRVGDLDDYLLLYDEGKLTFEEKSIAEALLKHGALNSIDLRQKAHLSANAAKSRFERALASLQRGLWVLPVGVAEAGAWRYSHVYELFDRWYPEVLSQARKIPRKETYRKLISTYLASVGVATVSGMSKLFQWEKKTIQRALDALKEKGQVIPLKDESWATIKFSK